MRRRAGSSILDLLAIIGIISILIALLLPTFAKARQQSRMVSCKAQLLNIGTAFAAYLNDNDGKYPPAPYSPSFNPQKRPIVTSYLKPYLLERTRVFECPADEEFSTAFHLSYSYNQRLAEATRVLSELPSGPPVLWDADAFHGGDVPFNWLMADGSVTSYLEDAPPPGERR